MCVYRTQRLAQTHDSSIRSLPIEIPNKIYASLSVSLSVCDINIIFCPLDIFCIEFVYFVMIEHFFPFSYLLEGRGF